MTGRGIYADHVRGYLAAGWPSVLPLPPGQKDPPVPGLTGYAGRWPSRADHQTLAQQYPNGNISLRLPPTHIGLDVDAYGNKRGAETLAEREARLGPLPPTVASTSRDDGISRIKLFRVRRRPPAWKNVGPGIETISFGWRYAMVWPSIHPDTGATYGWFYEHTGELLGRPPRLDEPLWLPDAWEEDLARTEAPADKGDITDAEVLGWFEALPDGPACHATAKALERFHAELISSGSRHDAARDRVAGLLRVGEMGHHGVRGAVSAAQARFLSALSADRPRQAPAEWNRMLAGGVGLVVAKPTAAADHGCGCAPDLPPFEPDLGAASGNGDGAPKGVYSPPPAPCEVCGANCAVTVGGRRVHPPCARGGNGGGGSGGPYRRSTAGGEGEPDPASSSDLWDARKNLRLVHQWARARGASPAATLVAVLCRVIAATPPLVVLPPLVGAEAPLNLFALLVGRSGGGKGAAERAADAAVDLSAGQRFHVTGPGSGEGVAHLFAHRVKIGSRLEVEQHTTAVLLVAPEVDTVGALMSRQASTLMPELRKAWDGERLGFAYADPAKRLPVGAHAYRLCLSVGVQPGRAGPILDDSEAGTPQRFVWVPTRDPGIPDVAPDEPERIIWTPPRSTRDDDSLVSVGGLWRMEVCADAVSAVRAANIARHREPESVNALDGHALQCRERVAAALGIFDGHYGVTDEDWQLAGIMQGWSDQTRDYVANELARKAHQTNHARAVGEGHRDVVREQMVDDGQVKRVCSTIIRKLGREGDWVPGNVVRRGVKLSLRQHFDDAVERLVDAGQIEAEHVEYQGQLGVRLRLTGAGR